MINLFGSGQIAEILSACDRRFLVEGYVVRNELGRFHLVTKGGDRIERAINLNDLVDSGVLEVVELTSDEEASTYIALATEGLDEGEARTAAIAIYNGHDFATDERAARKVLGRDFPALRVIGTPTLLRSWAENTSASRDQIRAMLRVIEIAGRYVPTDRDIDGPWWLEITGRC